MMKERKENLGILTSISWHSNNWKGDPTAEDEKLSQYGYVKDNALMHESLNFAIDLPLEKDDFFIGYSPKLNNLPSVKNAKDVKIIFLISTDYLNKRKCIVGFYGFPEFSNWYDREANHEFYRKYNGGNIKSLVDDIIYFENYLLIDNSTAEKQNFLPEGKKISQQGFNYLSEENVYNILQLSYQLNKNNNKLKDFIHRFPLLIEMSDEIEDLSEVYSLLNTYEIDKIKELKALESKMKKLRPKVKERLSKTIERGAIANKVKEITNYECLVCKALGQNPLGFTKQNGINYVETHHVEPVSNQKEGSLSITNLITVCANHHRQLHYGNTELLENTIEYFKFKIDCKEVKIKKIEIK
jgi:5-methylcytosine-specific restriction enzyme A